MTQPKTGIKPKSHGWVVQPTTIEVPVHFPWKFCISEKILWLSTIFIFFKIKIGITSFPFSLYEDICFTLKPRVSSQHTCKASRQPLQMSDQIFFFHNKAIVFLLFLKHNSGTILTTKMAEHSLERAKNIQKGDELYFRTNCLLMLPRKKKNLCSIFFIYPAVPLLENVSRKFW